MMSEMTDDLNPQQRQAVQHDTGPLLVVAGAGTGKTQVITRRIGYLINHRQIPAHSILALTFTEKAAQEMAERLYDLIGWQAFSVGVMTFNAFGAQLLLQYAPHIGRSVQGGLLNDTQKALILLDRYDRLKLSYYGSHQSLFEFLEGMVGYINQLQNSGVSLDKYREYVTGLIQKPLVIHPLELAEQQDLLAIFELYEAAKAETATYDYHDQLALPLKVLQQKPNIAERLGQEFRYVLVDEYQDTNLVQDQLLRSFVGKTGNIFAVGDDDQAIYGFRGADISNILAFADHYQLSKPTVLIENYRSGQPILDLAYGLIQHNNPDRLEVRLKIDKHLRAQTLAAEVAFRAYRDQTEELVSLTEDLTSRFKYGDNLADIAVLATSRAPLRALAKRLRQAGLPFAISAEADIFEQGELKQLWYLLEWVGNRISPESLSHVLLGPFIGWDSQTYQRVNEQAQKWELGFEATFHRSPEPAAKSLLTRLELWREWAEQLPISRLAYQLVFETGVSEQLIAAAETSDRIVRVFEDLAKLLGQMESYEAVTLDPTLAGYLALFPKPPVIEVNEVDGDASGVQLLTVHGAKGLEFETVYLINCTQNAWSPSSRGKSYQVPKDLITDASLPPEHEYRRLMYVAVTRAKTNFIASAPQFDLGGRRVTTSKFIDELFGEALPKDFIQAPKAASLEKVMSKLQRYYPLQQQYQNPRLPFETEDGWLELGVNDLGSYDFCPYDFYLHKVLHIAQPYGPQLAFGTALHGAFEYYYKSQLVDEQVSEEAVFSRFNEMWTDRGYERPAQAVRAREVAESTLRRFLNRERSQSDRKLEASEFVIRLELPEAKLRLRGKIDALFQIDQGIEIRDFKTGTSKTDAAKLSDDAKKNFQLRCYDAAYSQMTGHSSAQVVLDYVVTDTIGIASLTPAIRKNHLEKLVSYAEAIRARQFAPNTAALHNCAAIKYYGTIESEDNDATAG